MKIILTIDFASKLFVLVFLFYAQFIVILLIGLLIQCSPHAIEV